MKSAGATRYKPLSVSEIFKETQGHALPDTLIAFNQSEQYDFHNFFWNSFGNSLPLMEAEGLGLEGESVVLS